MSFTLPTHSTASIAEPRKMFIFSHPKIGKTSLVSQLPNHLLIDLESGASFYDNTRFDLRDYCLKNKVLPKKALDLLTEEIKKHVIEKGSSPYDFIIVDTTSVLEDIARGLATEIYKGTTQGKNFTGKDVVSELPNGAG